LHLWARRGRQIEPLAKTEVAAGRAADRDGGGGGRASAFSAAGRDGGGCCGAADGEMMAAAIDPLAKTEAATVEPLVEMRAVER
jgi:hypothetical protein